MRNRFWNIPWLTLCALGAVSGSLRADEFIADQRNEFDGSGLVPFYSLLSFTTIGQEFTPSTNALSFVDLLTYGGGESSARLQVLIRQGSITSPAIGASDLVLVTNRMSVDTNRFRFTPAVALMPGRTYVLQVVTFGNDFWSVGANSDTYAGGRLIQNGQPDSSRDLWFREGCVVPAPDSPLLSIRISHLTVSWSSSTGKTYQVQYRSDLTTNTWTNLGSPVAGNGLTNSVIDVIADPQRFYRVITLP